eukprot:m.203308 g.203308  ORF g.203308 m.203308 type:complete len:431 (+) comp21976_c2_seq1:54-1346(+)
MVSASALLGALSGCAAQASWWTFSTAAPLLAHHMPDLAPAFAVGLTFGFVGLAYALVPFAAPGLRSAEAHLGRHAKVGFVVQGALTAAVAALFAAADALFGAVERRSYHQQQTLLAVVCVLFGGASLASFRCQENMNGLLGKLQLGQSVWVGGVSCALILGLLQVLLRPVAGVSAGTSGVVFLATGAVLSLLGLPAIFWLDQPAARGARQALLNNPDQDPDQRGSRSTAGGDGDGEGADGGQQPRLGLALAVLRAMPVPYAVMCIDFCYMMSIYPGLLSVLHGREQASSNFSIFLFLAFNGGDFVGKLTPAFFTALSHPATHKHRLLLALALEIAVFLPLVCAAAAEDQLHADWLAYLLACGSATVHGIVTVSSYIAGEALRQDRLAHLPSDAAAAAVVLAGQLNFAASFTGVGLGTALSLAFRYSPLVD